MFFYYFLSFILCFSENFQSQKNISDYFYICSSICIYNKGTQLFYTNDDINFKKLLFITNKLFKNSTQVPALGVSLDTETRKELKTGIWIEFIYNKTQSYNEMPFDSLLIKINQNCTGINIIRKYNNKYQGRCFYVNLNTDPTEYFNIIKRIYKM